MRREKDPYEHRGITGWHHHHGPFGAVDFHEQGAYQGPSEEDIADGGYAPDLEWSLHHAAHDEYQGNDEPCRDPECVWLLPFGVEGGSTIGLGHRRRK